MNSTNVKWMSWVRMFDIPEVSKHKNGFTLYKVISMLYPESCPDAVTKVTVWKRFNDFKILHKEMKILHKRLNIIDIFPDLPKSALFKRFSEETISNRKQAILNLLEYIGNHSALFTSTVFVKFFETGHTPIELLNGNINTIRAELNLPEDTDLAVNSDDDKLSDTDSFTSSTVGCVAQSTNYITNSELKDKTNLKKLNSMTSINSHSSKASESYSILNVDNNLSLFDGQFFASLSETPCSSMDQEDVQYLIDASLHVNMGIELENERKYEEAFIAYKAAVEILIHGGKSDTDYDRKRMVKYKTEKYLIRAEKIYNMYLAPEVKNLHSQTQANVEKPNIVKGPLFNLYKYKVIKIISPSGILVLHSEYQQLCYIKVIHKTVQFLNDHLILPENVPYMVKLVSHYNCENALFLVLEYCSGTKLTDYLKNESVNITKDQLLKQIHDQSDNESEISFSELISDYTSSRDQKDNLNFENRESDSDSSFEKVDVNDPLSEHKLPIILDSPLGHLDDKPCLSSTKDHKRSLIHNETTHLTERKLSEMSSVESYEEFDCKSSVSEEQIVVWASQLLLALEKLHSLGIICRDLCIENILLDENKNVVLTYMCNVKEFCDLYTKGVNINLAPEVYSFEDVTEAVDWWSFGAILYELLVGMPLSKVHPNGMMSYTHLKIPKFVSAEGRSLLKQLLIYEPHERLGSSANGTQHLKSHPFFRTVSWDCM